GIVALTSPLRSPYRSLNDVVVCRLRRGTIYQVLKRIFEKSEVTYGSGAGAQRIWLFALAARKISRRPECIRAATEFGSDSELRGSRGDSLEQSGSRF